MWIHTDLSTLCPITAGEIKLIDSSVIVRILYLYFAFCALVMHMFRYLYSVSRCNSVLDQMSTTVTVSCEELLQLTYIHSNVQ